MGSVTDAAFDAQAVHHEPNAVIVALVRWVVLIALPCVCVAAFIIATTWALKFLRQGRPIGAPYVYQSLPSTNPKVEDEESPKDVLGSDFKGEIKSI